MSVTVQYTVRHSPLILKRSKPTMHTALGHDLRYKPDTLPKVLLLRSIEVIPLGKYVPYRMLTYCHMAFNHVYDVIHNYIELLL